MKKLFTLAIGFVALLLTTNAQNVKTNDGIPVSRSKQPISITKKAFHPGPSRAATVNIVLDYDGVDEAYATISGGTYDRFAWDINKKYSPTDLLTLKYAAVIFDTLLYLNGQGNREFIPRSTTNFVLDSFDLVYAHSNASTHNDTLIITVFNRASLVATGVGTAAGTLTATTLWADTIITNQSLSTGTNYAVMTKYPNLTFAAGQTFGVRVDFTGDTLDKFQIAIGSRDDCAQACLAAPSAAGFNTYSFLNWDGQFPNTGLYNNQIYFDCNTSGGYEAAACENIFLQNASIIPYLTATVNYGAVITADSLKGCPGSTLTLNANAFGSSSPTYTYSWATTNGTLTSTTDQSVDLVIGSGNAVVTVTVTDGNSTTTSSTVTVTSKGINITITNANPLTLNCGSTATVATTISGSTTGKNYTWSTGATGASASTIQISTAGNYSVTVTNNSGCSASAALSVIYPGNVTNTVTFTNPPSPICEDHVLTFTNTTTNQNGWTPQWTFGDGNLGFTANGTNTYANPGVYTVWLQETDANNCVFRSANVNVTVLAASNGACSVGIEDVTFANAINLLPNPSNGNVSITVNGVEKNISIRVYNVIGSEVKTFNANDVSSTFNKTFDFSDLANGTYLVKIQSADRTAVKRLTINK